MYVNVEDWRAE